MTQHLYPLYNQAVSVRSTDPQVWTLQDKHSSLTKVCYIKFKADPKFKKLVEASFAKIAEYKTEAAVVDAEYQSLADSKSKNRFAQSFTTYLQIDKALELSVIALLNVEETAGMAALGLELAEKSKNSEVKKAAKKVEWNINVGENGQGTITMSGEGNSGSGPASYNDGKFSATISQQGVSFKLSGTIVRDDNGRISGSGSGAGPAYFAKVSWRATPK